MIEFKSFEWISNPPEGIPFEQSQQFSKIFFTGKSSDYCAGDTWYPSWASDDNLYSPYTDGITDGIGSNSDFYSLNKAYNIEGHPTASTGNAVAIGNDPLNLKLKSLGVEFADTFPYGGRYPCGSLVHNGVWYYGTYCLGPYARTRYGETDYNWPQMGPFVGFRISKDLGKTWLDCPHTPEKPLFGETGICGYPVKIGSPHFVDFGKNMMYAPDGKAYLVAHGSDLKYYPVANFTHLSWITGDQIYLIRVTPTIETINDPNAYEFFAGYDVNGQPIWSHVFKDIQPMLEWQNNMGCVTITYNAPLRKYIMAVTDGESTCSKMHTYILESDDVTGPWKLISYMKNFGEQGYFVNFPSKFISEDGKKMWICYSGNFATNWNECKIHEIPTGSRYGLVLQEIEIS